jgi:sugar lactone lactonase YvrE
MSADSPVQCVADVHAVLGEGPVWVARENALYWLDIKGLKIFRLDERDHDSEWPTPFRIGSIPPTRRGGFIGGTEGGLAEVDPGSKLFKIFLDPESERPDNRFNDGKLDRQGRFWAGTMDDAERQDSGTLYRVDADRSIVAVDGQYRVTNGPAFSPDGSIMYHNDSARQVTYAFDIDGAGAASNKRTFLQFGKGDGFPDGMTVDGEGCLWIAFWDGWCLRRYAPDGEWVETIKMPVQRPTSCTFGGPDLDRLYITSASIGLDEEALRMQPNAGGLFMTMPGVRGLADVPFAG